MIIGMKDSNFPYDFPYVFNLRLSQPEAEYLSRTARENDRTRAAEVRRLIRREMQTDGQPATMSQIGRPGP
jgi:hypothetical protein